MEVPAQVLNDTPNGTQVHIELLGPIAAPAAPVFGHRLLKRCVFDDGTPAIAVSFYDFTAQLAELDVDTNTDTRKG